MKAVKHGGKCKLCGELKALTFEHVPPKRAFNSVPVMYYSFDEAIKAMAGENGRMPWDFTGLKGEKQQNGIQTNAVVISTLSETDFLIHLCCHLFKEATTYDWVINRRDLMLYKFSDINVYVHTYGNKIFFRSLYERIKYFGLEEECYYAFENSSIIYPRLLLIPGYRCLLQSIRPNNVDYMKQIVYPKERTLYEYTVSFEEWFNEPNRMNLLKKIN